MLLSSDGNGNGNGDGDGDGNGNDNGDSSGDGNCSHTQSPTTRPTGVSEHLTIEDGILYYKLRLYVPKGLIQEVLESERDSRVAGHFGQDKTIELIRRNFWWPGMKNPRGENLRRRHSRISIAIHERR